ncbi:MAG: polysaccharide biosynthesis/export family protein [Verrucomicrobiota bacterium]
MNRFFLALLLCLFGFADSGSGQSIRKGTAIFVTVSGVPESEMRLFNGKKFPVSENAEIILPHIGKVLVEGLSEGQAAAEIISRYKNAGIYENPTVVVWDGSISCGVDEPMVTVGGVVNKPGPVTFVTGLTLGAAVQAAGGPIAGFGNQKRVKLFRDQKVTEHDLTKEESEKLLMQKNDTVEIPRKNPFSR